MMIYEWWTRGVPKRPCSSYYGDEIEDEVKVEDEDEVKVEDEDEVKVEDEDGDGDGDDASTQSGFPMPPLDCERLQTDGQAHFLEVMIKIELEEEEEERGNQAHPRRSAFKPEPTPPCRAFGPTEKRCHDQGGEKVHGTKCKMANRDDELDI